MRSLGLLLALGLTGCSCADRVRDGYMNGGDIVPQRLSKFCSELHHGTCPTAAEIDLEAIAAAHGQWVREGRCAGVNKGTWLRGTSVLIGGGFCAVEYWFDRDGNLVQADHGCEAEVHHFGWSLGAGSSTPAPGPDYCDDARAAMTLKGARVRPDVGLIIDGQPAATGRAPKAFELGYGSHQVTAGGRTSELSVIDGPAHEVLLELGPGELPWRSSKGVYATGVRLPAKNGPDLSAELPDGSTAAVVSWDWFD